MAVRTSVQGFLGNLGFKGWKEDRAADSKPCDTLTDVGAKQRKGLRIKGLLLSFLCSALSPAAHNQRKGRVVAWLQASGAFPGKTIQCGGRIFLRSTFPSLAWITLKPLLVYISTLCIFPLYGSNHLIPYFSSSIYLPSPAYRYPCASSQPSPVAIHVSLWPSNSPN